MPLNHSLLLWRIATVVWMVNMSAMSTESFSSAESKPMLEQVLSVLGIRLSQESFCVLHTILRKSAHAFEYAVLAALAYRSLHRNRPMDWQLGLAGWTFLGASIYALLDEFHQSFVPGRGPSLADCTIDMAGALLGLALLNLVTTRIHSIQRKVQTWKA